MVKYSGTVDSRGRTTIPREIRERLELKGKGVRVEFICEGDTVVLQRAIPNPNPFEKYQGISPNTFKTRKQIIAWVRDLRDE